MLPYIEWFGHAVPAYGLMAVLGGVAAFLYVFFTSRGGRAGHLAPLDVLRVTLVAVLAAVLGGKVLYALTALPLVAPRVATGQLGLWPAVARLFSGMVFYGGLAGGTGAVLLFARRCRLPARVLLGLFGPAVPLFHAFGRLGCFLGGCCWGVPVPWGIRFTRSLYAPNGVALLPIQLVEAGLNLALFLWLARLSRRLGPAGSWQVFPLYLAVYAGLRFVLEFLRGDALRGVWLLSASQWISLGILATLAVWHAKRRRGQARQQA